MIDRGAGVSELMLEALANLRGQGRRSVLALLGVVIGSAAIVALMNIAHMAQIEALRGFRQTGVDLLSIQRDAANGEGLDVAELTALVAADRDALTVVPFATSGTTMRADAKSQSVVVAGITPPMNAVAGLNAAQGRLLVDVDGCSPVVVLGHKLATDLSTPGAALGPGRVVYVGGYGYTVVGVLKAVEPQALSPIPFDDAVLTSLACARRIMPHEGATGALIRLRADADAAAAAARYTAALASPTAPTVVRDAKTMIQAMRKQMDMLGGVLVAVGSISLLVGGVGVMNVMLMTVMERRREIGLRAAIGATPGEIRLMFLIEAVILALGGGILGDVLGVALTGLVTLFTPFGFAIDWRVLFLGAGVAAAVGLVFGLYPAIAASRIQPIEALRAD